MKATLRNAGTAAPEVSVVMAVRNGEPFLQPAIESILRQDFNEFEFLIINDGSTDATRVILDAQTDSRIRVFHREPAGLPASLNFGISQARAELVARQDADDLSEPARLSHLTACLKSKPDAVLVHSACHFDTQSGMTTDTCRIPRTRALMELLLCRQNMLVHGSVMFRKSAFLQAGGYEERYSQSQDFDLWGRMVCLGPFAYHPSKLYRLRKHEQSVSVTKAVAQEVFRAQISLANCRRMFPNASAAQRTFEFFSQSRAKQSPFAWLQFICRDLPRLRHQSLELYLWGGVQLARSFKSIPATAS